MSPSERLHAEERLHAIGEIRRVLIDDGVDPDHADRTARKRVDRGDVDRLLAYIAEHHPAPTSTPTPVNADLLDALTGHTLRAERRPS